MELELIRSYYEEGTNGALAYNGQTICATIELPWKNNRARISCIPEGRYPLIKRYSPKFKNHFLLENVKDRQFILIHPANNAALELKGCIAPVSLITGIGEGIHSVNAMHRIMTLLEPFIAQHDPIFITIKRK